MLSIEKDWKRMKMAAIKEKLQGDNYEKDEKTRSYRKTDTEEKKYPIALNKRDNEAFTLQPDLALTFEKVSFSPYSIQDRTTNFSSSACCG
ncbi:hypothetical protein FQA39_LY18878 [Lamprigera yunnana]|nr:hypothetical protein FQA39_LY18878 [Lamprigera yunnana]